MPYEVALENKRTLLSSTESRVSLDEQVKRLNTKATKLEQEKEHWMLEAQLLKIKYDKLQKVRIPLETWLTPCFVLCMYPYVMTTGQSV